METILQIALSNAVVASTLAVLALLVSRFARRPALAHGLWLLVLIKLLTPPLFRVPITLPSSISTQVAETESNVQQPEPAAVTDVAVTPLVAPEDIDPHGGEALVLIPKIDEHAAAVPVPTPAPPAPATVPVRPATLPRTSWGHLLLWCWAAGSVAWMALALTRIRRFRRLLRFSEEAPHWLQREVAELARQLGLKHPPQTRIVPGRLTPMIWAIGSPQLLVPQELLPKLSAAQRKTVLLHELAHVYRRDHWVRLLELTSMALFWWHPVVWWARRELRDAEEQCCDAWVVATLPGMGKSYATALIECLGFLSDAPSPLPMAASGIEHVRPLKRRLTMILSRTTPQRLGWLSGLSVLTLGALLLPVLPTFADEKKEEERKIHLRFADDVDVRVDGADVKQAAAEVQELKALLEKQRDQLRVTETRLKRAAEKLAKISKGKAGSAVKPGEHRIRVVIVRDGKKEEIELHGDHGKLTDPKLRERILQQLKLVPLKGKDGKLRLHLELLEKAKLADLQRLHLEKLKDAKGGGLFVPKVIHGADHQKRFEQMEKQLKQLQQQLQDLQRHLKDKQSSEQDLRKNVEDKKAAAVRALEAARQNAALQAVKERDKAVQYLRALEAAKQQADAARRDAELQRKRAEELLKKALEKKDKEKKPGGR